MLQQPGFQGPCMLDDLWHVQTQPHSQSSILQEGWAWNEAGFRLASLPGSPERELYVHGEPGIFFSCDHDVIKIGPGFLEQKGNISHIVQQTMHLTLGVYIIQPPIARYV